jgi:uncharacterized membrane protein
VSGARTEAPGPRIERTIEMALTAGLLLSSALFALGLLTGEASLLRAGVLLLMFTPVARVVILTVSLFRQRDLRFALVSLFVLGVLLFGVAVSAYRP